MRLDSRSKYLRSLALSALEGGNRGHVGSTMSLIEIFRVLYDDILKYDVADIHWELRDRCILSKGHGCIAQYVILADKGFFPIDELKTFCHYTSRLGGHPELGELPGIEASTGSLGHGLSIAVGMALALRMKKLTSRVFTILGDGEINEGSVWEAAMSASKHRLSNLIALIDYNKLQSYGPTQEVLDLEPLVDKWRSFGFAVVEVDGHDVDALKNVLLAIPVHNEKPTMIICHTVKGRGFLQAEGNVKWHHKSQLSHHDIQQLIEELKTS